MIVERDVELPMSDGVVIAADVFRPQNEVPAPVIMSLGPYGKGIHFRDGYGPQWDQLISEHPEILDGSSGDYMVWELADPERWIPLGYVLVRVDSRGAGRSEGYLDPLSPREIDDYYEAIEWAGVQPWSNGKIGLCGVSYYAMTQWLVAARQPPHLSAMVVWEGAQDSYRDFSHHGGILCNVFAETWFEGRVVRNQHGQGERGLPDRGRGGWAAGPETIPEAELAARRADLPSDFRKHALIDDYHRERTSELSRVTAPLLSAANWSGYGLHSRGNFRGYQEAASSRKWLEVHGGRHEEWFYLPAALDLQHRFFDHFLKGLDNGWDSVPPVWLHIRRPGEHFELREEHEWPLARTQWTEFYLDARTGRLRQEPPPDVSAKSFDALGPGITFVTAPLEVETEITGPMSATLSVSSSTEDADLFLTVQAYLPDGREITFDGASDPAAVIAQGWLRLSHRRLDLARTLPHQPFHTHDRVEPVEPGRPYEVAVEIWPTCIVLPPGSTLSLVISGRDFARGVTAEVDERAQLVGRGSALFIHCDPTDRPASTFAGRTTVHCGGSRGSRLLVPVIPPPAGG